MDKRAQRTVRAKTGVDALRRVSLHVVGAAPGSSLTTASPRSLAVAMAFCCWGITANAQSVTVAGEPSDQPVGGASPVVPAASTETSSSALPLAEPSGEAVRYLLEGIEIRGN